MKKCIIFLLSFSIFITVPSTIYAKASNKEDPKVKSSILMCMDTGDVIVENNAYEHLSPASVTKIMSLLLIMEAIDSGKIKLTDMLTADETAVSKGGSQIWLEVGEQMSVEDLLKAVVIASANDACTLLGEYVAGSEGGFVDLMNSRVRELGLKNSNFENCTGLDDDITNHYSCSYDLAVIACELMKHDLIKKYSTVWLDSLRDGKTELNNTNKLVNKYDGITGLKTGTTSNAGFCLCATATRGNLSLVSVVLGADTSDDRFNASTKLLDYGFANYKLEKINIDQRQIKGVKINKGVVKEIKPVIEKNKNILIDKNAGELKYEYKIKESVNAPVKKGDLLGEIIVTSDKKQITRIPLNSPEKVEKVNFSYILRQLFKNI